MVDCKTEQELSDQMKEALKNGKIRELKNKLMILMLGCKILDGDMKSIKGNLLPPLLRL
jgi:hypothetical protein